MTNNEMIQVHSALTKHLTSYKGRLAYAVNRNINRIDSLLKEIQKTIEPSEEYKAFDSERIKLCEQYADKDETGNPKKQGNEFVITDKSAFSVEVETLNQKYQTTIADRDERVAAFHKLLDDEADLEWFTIKLDSIDIEDIPGDAMRPIMHFLED